MINQNVEIWKWMWESIKILKFERKRADLSNVEIYCKGGYQTKFWNLGVKGELKMLEFKWKVRNQSKCWNLGVKGRLIKFECQMSSRSKCWNLSDKGIQIDQNAEMWVKGGINGNIQIWRKSRELIKMLKIEY